MGRQQAWEFGCKAGGLLIVMQDGYSGWITDGRAGGWMDSRSESLMKVLEDESQDWTMDDSGGLEDGWYVWRMDVQVWQIMNGGQEDRLIRLADGYQDWWINPRAGGQMLG